MKLGLIDWLTGSEDDSLRTDDLPIEFDWREKNIVTEAKQVKKLKKLKKLIFYIKKSLAIYLWILLGFCNNRCYRGIICP